MKILDQIAKKAQDVFPDVVAIIVWGGAATPEFKIDISDIDMVFVLPKIDASTREGLKKVIDEFKDVADLDLFAVTLADLQKEDLIFIRPEGGVYPLHKMDQYKLLNVVKVILDSNDILSRISPVTIEEAIDDIIPHVSNKVTELQEEIKQEQDEKKFITDNLGHLLVIARTIYSIEEKDIISKAKSLQYLYGKNPKLKPFLTILENMYLKNKTSQDVSEKEIINFLELAQSKIKKFNKTKHDFLAS